MNQLTLTSFLQAEHAMEREQTRIDPAPNTQQATLLAALQRGEQLTLWDALHLYGVAALSQRMGDLRRMGWPVQSQTLKLSSGKRISQYWMDV